jgi:hypothetical protein
MANLIETIGKALLPSLGQVVPRFEAKLEVGPRGPSPCGVTFGPGKLPKPSTAIPNPLSNDR